MPLACDTNPKRKRGPPSIPRLRFGLVSIRILYTQPLSCRLVLRHRAAAERASDARWLAAALAALDLEDSGLLQCNYWGRESLSAITLPPDLGLAPNTVTSATAGVFGGCARRGERGAVEKERRIPVMFWNRRIQLHCITLFLARPAPATAR